MHQTREINGKSYRVILDHVSVANPEGKRVAVFSYENGTLDKLRQWDEMGRETDEELIERAWEWTMAHATAHTS